MKNLFTNLNKAAGSSLVCCNHNHALVHNPFAWNESAKDAKSGR